jgi:Glycosyl hydrolase catalytic core
VRTAKKGVGAWFSDRVNTALADSGASWYYTWKPVTDGVGAPGLEFVPMIWSGANVASDVAAAKESGAGVLLGFNEPDNKDQANMSVAQALDLWPQLQETGMRLGSPAVSSDSYATTGWLEQFMQGAAQRGYRVDFIAVHWYGQTFDSAELERLKNYLTDIHRAYGKPIWLTEYSLINWTSWSAAPMSRLAEFATESVAMLEDLSFVERYAWFSLPAADGWQMTGLYSGSTPTPAGAAYRSAS